MEDNKSVITNSEEITKLYKSICKNLRESKDSYAFNKILKLTELDSLNGKILLFLFLYANPHYKDVIPNIDQISNMLCLRYVHEEYFAMVEARKKLASYQFYNAYIFIRGISYNNGKTNYRVEVYRELSRKCADRKRYVSELIDDYFEEGKLAELKAFLESQPFLDDIGRIILKLLQDYEMILTTHTVKLATGDISHSMFDAIYKNDYEEALYFLQGRYRNPNKKNALNCLEYLLKEIIQLKESLMSSDSLDENMDLVRKRSIFSNENKQCK